MFIWRNNLQFTLSYIIMQQPIELIVVVWYIIFQIQNIYKINENN